jgi:hypothetical protein
VRLAELPDFVFFELFFDAFEDLAAMIRNFRLWFTHPQH